MIVPVTPLALAIAVALDQEARSRPRDSEWNMRDLMLAIMEKDAMMKVDYTAVQETSALLRAVSNATVADPGSVSFISLLTGGGFAVVESAVLQLSILRFAQNPQHVIADVAVKVGADLVKSWPRLLAQIDIHNHLTQGRPAEPEPQPRKEDES